MDIKTEFINPFLEATVHVSKTMTFIDPSRGKLGAEKKRMQVKVAGGSQIMDESGYFNIGERNDMALRKIFWMNNVLIRLEDVRGNVNRTLSIELFSGKGWVKPPGNEIIGI
jgi:chemotaxis protein CheD